MVINIMNYATPSHQQQLTMNKYKLKCYYAHPMLCYDSLIEEVDLALLQALGFEILNPNSSIHQEKAKEFGDFYGKDKIMDYFKNLVSECEVVAFRGLPKGEIPSGVAVEVQHAIDLSIPVIELPSNVSGRMMTYPETKSYFYSIGFYKRKD